MREVLQKPLVESVHIHPGVLLPFHYFIILGVGVVVIVSIIHSVMRLLMLFTLLFPVILKCQVH